MPMHKLCHDDDRQQVNSLIVIIRGKRI